MENSDAKKKEDIKSILEGLSSDDSTIVVSDGAADGRLEFRFESDKKLGLVFEDDEQSAGLCFEADGVELSADPVPESATPFAESAPAAEPIREEFALPESFDAAAEEQSVLADESTRVWSTYVPRFTEVSETYRMNNDPRPRPEKSERTVVDADELERTDIDPTAESVEDSVADAVVVNVNQKAEEDEQTFSVYKFSDSEPDVTEEKRERTVEDERAEIEDLVRRKEEITAEDDVPAPPRFKRSEPEQRAKSYDLPDPERDSRVHVVDYSGSVSAARTQLAEAPEGADDSSVPTGKKKGRTTEFTAHMQRDAFKDRFLDSIMSAKIRFFAALILTLVMLAFENLGLFNVDLEEFLRLETLPGAMAIADLQFAACIFVLALPEVCRAFRALAGGKVLPELSLVTSLAVLTIYTVITALETPITYPLFGSLVAAVALAAIAGTCFKRSADFTAFKRASKNGEKRILDKKLTRTLERENLALDGAVDEYKSKTARLFKTTFVSDFFKRSSESVENSVNVIAAGIASVASAAVGAVIAYFVGDGWISAAPVFAAIALFTAPAVSLLVHKLPFYHSSLECELEKSAVIGEGSVYEYSGVDVIAFEDTDIFGVEDVNLKRIIHYGDVDNMMKAMRQMSAIFANVGGPLNTIFANSLDRKCSPAIDPEIEFDGISGKVDGHVVRAGTAEYMLRHGITLPASAESSRAGMAASTKVMYGAEDGVVYVQFHIRYSFSEEFTMILPTLKKEKIVPLIYTRDPNVTGELVRTLTSGDDCIRVMKKNNVRCGEDKIYRRISAGIVTSGDKLDAIGVILLTKKYVRLMKTLSIAELAVMGAGCILSAVLAIVGALGISSAFFIGWHALWCFVLYIVSRKSFTVKKKEENNDDR